MDILDDILSTLDLRGVLYFRTSFSSPWALTVPDYQRAARFHLVVQGTAHITIEPDVELELGPGDLVMIPRGVKHTLSDNGARSAPELETVMQDTGYNGRGVLIVGEGDPNASTQMVCGHLNFRRGGDHPLLDALPDYIHVHAAERSTEPWLDDALRLVAQRVFSGALGSAATVTRLSEIVFIEVIKSRLSKSEELRQILQAFTDPHVGQALNALHANPADAWTVETLAHSVGMSRSRFSDRFSELMGKGPMSYLSDWRLQKALQLLDDDRISVQQIATQAGYRSPAAFSRAFSAKFGASPKVYQRQVAT